MGKNQQHKARQASKHPAPTGGNQDADVALGQGVDASFHTAEWHAARLAALQVERPSWEDWKQKQKEEEFRERQALEEQERLMAEYKRGLEADRERRLRGSSPQEKKKKKKKRRRDHSEERNEKRKRSNSRKKSKKDKKHSKKSKKKRRHSSDESSSSESYSSTSSDDDDGSEDSARQQVGDGSPGPIKLSEYLHG